MPLSRNKVKVNVYLTREQHKLISNWAKDNGVSVSSLYCTFTKNFLQQEENGENSWILVNKNNNRKISNFKAETQKDEFDIIKDNFNNNEFDILMYNIEHSEYMNGF